jgi:SAM-dependent methyltransferase
MTVPQALDRTYGAAFYDELEDDVRSSADVIVPIVTGLVRPASVLDVGCGRGTWLATFAANGVTDYVGVDGPHVAAGDLAIPPERFVAHDLSTPVAMGRRFDLVVSLEVAEHLGPALGDAFVASLVAHAPCVLFSAAVPFQGGAGHVNERWPSQWAQAFAAHDYVAVDAIRPAVWADERVAFWYAQNTLLYVERSRLADIESRVATPGARSGPPLDLVHPGLHVRDHTRPARPAAPPSLSRVLRDLPGAAYRAVSRRARGTRGHAE